MVIQSECSKPERSDDKDRKRSRSREGNRYDNRSKRRSSPSRRKRSRSKDRRSRTPPSLRNKSHRSRSRSQERGKRYWEEKHEDKDKEQYWNKYPRSEKVGKRYYGGDEGKDEKSDPKNASSSSKDGIEKPKKKKMDLLTTRTGGAYIPPARLKMMQDEITDKSSIAYQRISWEALKKSIHGFINKVNTANIAIITREMFKENIIRARGLLCKSLMQAQAASPTFTHVYAALVSVINTKFPSIGELLLKRLIKQFKNSFRRNNKPNCISSVTFIAHLVNQKVAHEIVGLEILSLLIESSTNDSIEVAIEFLKQSGQKLTEVSSKGLNAIFDLLRNILHEGHLEKRVQYMIEVMFQMRKDGFKDNPAIIEELELVEDEDQITHLLTLDEVMDSQDILNVFKADPDFEENEEKYKKLMKEILDSDTEEEDSNAESGSSSDEEEDEENEEKSQLIVDNTETNLVALRRTIYLTIHSSLDYEECAHKLMKMQLKKNQEPELCHMFLDCCAEQRTYEKFYGLLAQRFCMINKIYITLFEQIFRDTYSTTHRLDTNRLRNVGKFFAHLLFTDAICWDVLEVVRLNEDDTTSSSRIFIKILFQELVEYLGLSKLNERLKDITLQESFAGLFPRNNPRDTRFAINFFTSIGLGGLTDELREHLKVATKAPPILQVPQAVDSSSSSSSESSSDSSSSDSESSSTSSSSSSSSDSNKEKDRRKKKKSSQTRKRKKSDNDKQELEKEKNKRQSEISIPDRKQRHSRKSSVEERGNEKDSSRHEKKTHHSRDSREDKRRGTERDRKDSRSRHKS